MAALGFARVRWVRDALGRVVERRAVDLGTGVESVTRYGFTGAGDSSSVVVEQVVGLPGGVGVSRRPAGSV